MAFHYSEVLKSGVFLLMGALESLDRLTGDRLTGGEEVVKGILAAFKREFDIAKRYLLIEEVESVEKKVGEAERNISLHQWSQVDATLAEALSGITTISARYMKVLEEAHLV